MKDSKGFQFISTTVIGGLLFLVPVVFLVFILNEAIDLMMIVAGPLADWIPVDTIGGVALANLIAIFAVIVVCFLAGLVARNAMASGFVSRLESKVLTKIPGYTLVKGIKGGFEQDKNSQFKPVTLALGTAERVGFEIQKLSDGRSMVFIPGTPNILSGITQILPADQITYLDAPITSIMELAEKYGYGVDELLAAKITEKSSSAAIELDQAENKTPGASDNA